MKNSDKNVVYNTNKFDIKNVNLYEIYIKYHPHILLINKNQNIVDLSFYKLPSILICDKSLILDKKNFENYIKYFVFYAKIYLCKRSISYPSKGSIVYPKMFTIFS